jgi:aminopeptidase N
MDRYFERNDGHAATIEDFLAALGEANDTDLSPYLAWYGQAGTPQLSASGRHDAATRSYTLTLRQHTPATPGQPHKRPLPIPVKLALFDPDGRMLPLHEGATEQVVVLEREEQSFVFPGVERAPVPSLLRGFSAPVLLDYAYAPAELALLLTHDTDGFNRWEAAQQLAWRAYAELRDGAGQDALSVWGGTLAGLFDQGALDQALLADLLTPPGEVELAERETDVDPARIHALRQTLQRELAARIGAHVLAERYRVLATQASGALDAASQAQRRLKRRVLELLVLLDAPTAQALAATQFDRATTMTDRLAALAVLARSEAPQATDALARYRARHADNALALDKWFAAQAQVPGEAALTRVRMLQDDPSFTLKNPNRVQALLGTWARGNPSGFHRLDGEGYRFLAARLAELDALNPQVAARLATAFNGWQRLEPVRREQARAAVAGLAGQRLSRNLAEIVGNMLKG